MRRGVGYWCWRGGLAVGKAIGRIGYRLLDLGWGLQDRAAHRWWRPEFTRQGGAP